MKQPAVYVLASARNGTIYVEVTSDLIKRIYQHKKDAISGFTSTHTTHDLVWFEHHETMDSAIMREKAIKEWKRAWKIQLIENLNPYWRGLYSELLDNST